MIFNKIKLAIRPLLIEQIHNHPFNVALCDGTLSPNRFRIFLEQDKLYLLDFSKALNRTAQRLSNKNHQQLFYRLSDEILKAEVELFHNIYLQQSTPSLFQPAQRAIQKTPIVFDYTEYLLSQAENSPVELAVASLLPCFYIYSELGLRMQALVKEDNPYRGWIDSYSTKEFLLFTQAVIETMNELGDECTLSEENQMVDAFIKSTKFEIAFWDSIYDIPLESQNNNNRILPAGHFLLSRS